MPALACPSGSLLPQWRIPAKAVLLAALLVSACSKSATPNAADTPKTPVTQEDRLIAQARAALGPEDKLLAVQTLRLRGQIFDTKNQLGGSIEFLFKKPAHQRSEFQTTTQDKVIECSNGVEGWMASSEKAGQMKFSIMKAPTETQNIYTSLENLYFYRATELVRGAEVTSEGPVTYRNNLCWKVSFHYPNDMIYVRYFDKTTGELRGTVVQPNGAEFVEEGKMMVAGIAFPTQLQNYTSDGKLTQTVKFTSIEVNAPMDDKVFEMPSLIALRAEAAKEEAASKAPATTAAPSQTTSIQPLPALPANQ
jgi:outer membrane lipoprotein-sorting protein